MAEKKPPIERFPNDGRPWRVDWFGKVIPGNPPLIEVFMSPFVGNPLKPTEKGSVLDKEQKIFFITVGELPDVHIGSIWRNKKRQSLEKYKYFEETLNLNIQPGTLRIIKAGFSEEGNALIPDNYFHIGGTGREAHCLLIHSNNYGHGIIIPIIEIIRFYYIQSSDLAKAIFNGDVLQIPKKLYNSEKSDFAQDGQTYVLQLRKEFDDSDAWIIARIAASEIARKHAEMIYSSISRKGFDREGVYPETYPPFEGSTTIVAYGKRIMSNDKWLFLVFWIESCSGKFPYNDLYLHRDNPGANPVPMEKYPIEDDQSTAKSRSKKKVEVQDAPLIIDEKPSFDMTEKTLLLNNKRFMDLNNKALIKPERETVKFSFTRGGTREKRDIRAYSTGDETYSKSDIQKLKYLTSNEGRKQEDPAVSHRKYLPVSLDRFIDALNKITSDSGDNITCNIFAVSEGDDIYESIAVSLFPKEDGDEHFPWVFIGRERRRVITAEITYGSNYFYLFEAEQLGSRNHDGYTSLLLHGLEYESLDKSTLKSVLVCCARNKGTWLKKSDLQFIHRIKIKHTWDTPDKFATKVISYIKKALGIEEL